MGHISANRERFRALRDAEHEGPIYMLNLLRYAPETGRARYEEYERAVMPLLGETGAKVSAMGPALLTVIGPDDEAWDEMIVVWYPSRDAFVGLVTSPEYQAIAHLRTEALIDSRLVCIAQAPPG